MESNLKVISSFENELEVKLTYEEIMPEIEAAYQDERKKISLPGFRKGKVPMNMLKKMFGEEIEYKASEEISNKKFWESVNTLDKKPISRPKLVDLNFEKGKSLEFKVQFEVMPEIGLKDYKDLGIERPLMTIEESTVEAEVENALRIFSTLEECDTVESKECRITVDLIRQNSQSNEFDSKGMPIDLSNERINPEIAENAMNKKAGDTFTFSFEHKAENDETITITYNAEIKKIEKYVKPEYTEEMIMQASQNKAKTVEEFKSHIRDYFTSYFENQADEMYENSLLAKVIENNNIPVPEGYKENIYEALLESEKKEAEKHKGHHHHHHETPKEKLLERAEWNVKWQILVENLCRLEKLDITDAEIEEMAKAEAEKTKIPVERLMKFFKDPHRTDALREDKVLKFLKENNPPVLVNLNEKIAESKKSADKKSDSKKEKK